jgi:hypothetical protein
MAVARSAMNAAVLIVFFWLQCFRSAAVSPALTFLNKKRLVAPSL